MAKSSTSYAPGTSGNPGGKPVGAKNRVTAQFLEALADDFKANGKKAIKACREKDPAAYVRACVALVPKDLTLKSDAPSPFIRALKELNDLRRAEELNGLSTRATNTAKNEAPVETIPPGTQRH